MKKLLTAVLLSAGCLAFSGAAGAKEGGLCFRFDDNKTPGMWNRLAEVFERHGFRFSAAFCTQSIADKAEFKTLLMKLSAAGHELLDHTPDHRMYGIQARSGEEFDRYRKNPGVHHADTKTRMVYLNYIPDLESRTNFVFRGTIRGNELSDVDPGAERRLRHASMIYVPQAGEVFALAKDSSGTLKIVSFWNEDHVNLPELKNMELMLMGRGSIAPTDDGMRLLAQESEANFRKLGVEPAKVWIQPTAWEPVVGVEPLLRIYGREFRYTGADSFLMSWPWGCSFSDPNPLFARFSMAPNGETLERSSVARMKTVIADFTAKHRVMMMASHMTVWRMPGGYKEFLRRHDELLKWVQEKKIPVRTMSEWSRELYGKFIDPRVNIMPSLTRDLDENGIPDGYTLNKGTAVREGVLSFPAQNGEVFSVTGLAGIEKDDNVFRFTGKALPGMKIVFLFRMYAHGQMRPSNVQRFEFPVTKAGWQTYSADVRVMRNAVVMDVVCRLENAQEGSVELKNPEFQAKPRSRSSRGRSRWRPREGWRPPRNRT